MKSRPVLMTAALIAWLSAGPTAQPGPPPGAAVYQAIRADNLSVLKTLVASPQAANARGMFGNTPLMDAAVAGSADALSYMIGAGADVNAQNAFGTTALIMSATQPAKVRLLLDRGAKPELASKQGRTALFVAAMNEGSAAIVRQLIDKGADVRVRDAFQNTTLIAAAYGNDNDTLRLILDAGVDVNAAGVTGVTPLLGAAYNGNVAAVRMLLAKGAHVNVVARQPQLFPNDPPKSGPISLNDVTPLLAAAARAPADLIKALLDAGADVNARDGRGMTPLMLAVATNRQNPAVIRMLLARGADPSVRSKVGETAADWARKLGVRTALELLKAEAPPRAAAAAQTPASAPVDAKTAAERGIALLETSSQKFFESSGCVSCHHQNAASMAAGEARLKGIRFDPNASAARIDMLRQGPPAALLLERMDISVPEILASALAGLAAEEVPPSPVTDMIAANLAATQALDGSWHIHGGIGERPPSADGAITRTALAVRSLKVYGSPARTDMTAGVERARRWLLQATPLTSEDRNMQLLGLHWAGADPKALKPLAAAILAHQRSDGAWAQHDAVGTDAYATGQSLYVLAKAGGVPPADPAYQRGVSYLLATQNANGSWRVASRAPKFQAFFNSGFPYGGDQWISAWATGWASMALAQAVPAATRSASGY